MGEPRPAYPQKSNLLPNSVGQRCSRHFGSRNPWFQKLATSFWAEPARPAEPVPTALPTPSASKAQLRPQLVMAPTPSRHGASPSNMAPTPNPCQLDGIVAHCGFEPFQWLSEFMRSREPPIKLQETWTWEWRNEPFSAGGRHDIHCNDVRYSGETRPCCVRGSRTRAFDPIIHGERERTMTPGFSEGIVRKKPSVQETSIDEVV